MLSRLRAFCFPGGEDSARRVAVVKTTQRGEIRSAPEAKWMAFTAEETTDSTRSFFRWEARFGGGRVFTVIDEYADGRGRLAMKLGGFLPLKKYEGPDFDRGELQRYLGALPICPSMLLNHPGLQWTATGPNTLRVTDPSGVWVEYEIGSDGCPRLCRAERPRLLGSQTVPTPWSGTASGFREWEGLRVADHIEASWEDFTYYRADIARPSPH